MRTVLILFILFTSKVLCYSQSIGGYTVSDYLISAIHPNGCDPDYIIGPPDDSTWVNFSPGDVITGNFGLSWADTTGDELLLETSFHSDNYNVRLLLSSGLYSSVHNVVQSDWLPITDTLWRYSFTSCGMGSQNSLRFILPLDFNLDFGLNSSDIVTGIEVTFLSTSGAPDLAGIYIITAACPSVSIGNDITLCQGEALTLDATITNATYLWQDNSTNSTFTAVQQGTYWVEVTVGCGISTDTINITYSAGPIIDLGNDTVLCQGETLTLDATTSNAAYLWQDNSTNPTFNVAQPGMYTVAVTDANGCIGRDTLIVLPQSLSIVSILANTYPTCFGMNDGEASVTSTGGVAPHSYLWNTIPIQTVATVTGLSAGTYTVIVSDINACSATDSIIISEPSPLALSFSSFSVTCAGNDGSAIVTASGGTGAYTYQWSTGGNNDTLLAIPDGVYSVTVTDANGCSISDTVTVTNNAGVSITLLGTTDVSCYGNNDGDATIAATGGTLPYTYSWNTTPIQTNAIATGLSPGAYNCTVIEAGGCAAILLANINEPPDIVVNISPDTTICPGETVSIGTSVTGGTQPYVYNWNNGLGNNSTINVSPTSTTTYTINVVDANLCVGNIQSVIVSTGLLPFVTVGGTVTICIGESTVISASAAGGISPYIYSWDNGGGNVQIATVAPINPTTYTVTVTDSCGIKATGSVDIDTRPDVGLIPPMNYICPGEEVTITASGALYYWWKDSLTGDTLSTFSAITVSPDVTTHYPLTASDGDCYKTDTAIVFVNSAPLADFVSDPPGIILSDPNFLFTDLTQGDPISWYWDLGDDSISLEQNPFHSYNDSGTYNVMLAVEDFNGCVDTVFKRILVMETYTLFVPNSFSPNGDGNNDYFFPIGLGVSEELFQMIIFNRWGDQIYETEGVFGDYESTGPLVGWDGTANGGTKLAQQDVYVWRIQAIDLAGLKHQYIGQVTLIRQNSLH